MEGRDLEGIVNAGQAAVNKAVQLPPGYRLDWGGEYSELLEAKSQIIVIGPLTVLLIFMILFALYGNFKFPITIALGVVMTEPVGALIALKLTHTPFSVSSILGLLALMGVSVETAVILVSYINKLRLEGMGIQQATLNASLAASASHHDDGSRRLPRLAARGNVHRSRQRHAKTFRDCCRRRINFALSSRIFRQSGAVSNGRKRWRRFAGVGLTHLS